MNKKILIPSIVGLLVLVIVGIVVFSRTGKSDQTTETTPTKKMAPEQVNTIPVAERPFIQIHPESDGRNVTLTVVSLKKTASETEYELEYQAGSLLQGAFGKLSLASLPSSVKILLGSCSAGGACTYHTDIQGGTLLTRYADDSKYALKSEWRYFDNTTKSPEVASKDAKFQLTSPELAKQRYSIVFNTPGYPDGLEGTVVSEIFSLETSSTLKGDGDLTLRANQEGVTHVAVWDGAEWSYIVATVEGKTITAEVPLAPLYLAVTK
ncbi:MAG TPA: hypothetical protein PKJ26_01340 [Candidatus Woesebacteria bacterium]|nr:hypothetical protein [Candidatus Woesebacteria bacterium]HNS65119.1 hypothetical protein [Candidatus Woesebacteria bacterium]